MTQAKRDYFPIACPHCGSEIELRRPKRARHGLAVGAYGVCHNGQCGAAFLMRAEIVRQTRLSAYQRDIKGLEVVTPRPFPTASGERPPG